MTEIRSADEVKKRLDELIERSKAFEKMHDLRMALNLIHRADELRWVLKELDDNYNETKPVKKRQLWQK